MSTVVHADEPLSFADLQEACGLAKSTTSRMLTALERAGLLERDGSGSYVAGRLFWLYAARHDPWEELVRLARPTMERIGADTDETVNLSVTRGERVVQVAQVDSRYLLGTRDWTEVDVPAHCSALGKVFSPTTCSRSRRAARAADRRHPGRRRRPAPGRQRVRAAAGPPPTDELEVGLTGVAVPVHRGRGEVVAALGISGPTPRLEGPARRGRPPPAGPIRSSSPPCCAVAPTRRGVA